MSEITVYAGTSDAFVQALNVTWSSVLSGDVAFDAVDNSWTEFLVGSQLGYYEDQWFGAFDTSAIPEEATVTAAVLSLYCHTSRNASQGVYIYAYDWGAAVDSTDWRNQSACSGGTRLASLAAGSFSTSAYTAFTSDAAFPAAIVKAGTTRLVAVGDRYVAGTTPTAEHRDGWHSGSQVEAPERRPRLVVTYNVPAGFTGLTVTRILQG